MLTAIDEETGKRIMPKQLELLLLLNPIEGHPPTYRDIAKKLGVSYMAIAMRMYNFKKRCPAIHRRFKELQRSVSRAKKNLGEWDVEKDQRFYQTKYIEECPDVIHELGLDNGYRVFDYKKLHGTNRVRRIF